MIKLAIRKESYFDPEVMSSLINTARKIARKIDDADIPIKDDTVIIWIKAFDRGEIYPKVEIDAKDQELQFDLDLQGNIREVHFKTFVQNPDTKKWERVDVDKNEAERVLQLVYEQIITV